MLEIFLMAQLITQDKEQKETMYILELHFHMPQPLDRPEMWSCERRPTLCLKGEENGAQE